MGDFVVLAFVIAVWFMGLLCVDSLVFDDMTRFFALYFPISFFLIVIFMKSCVAE